MDDFDVDGYITKINDLVDTSYPKTTLFWIEKYEPSPNLPIALLLESPPALELRPLPNAPTDTLLVIPNQEAQLIDILKAHKKAVGWDISKMRDNDIKIFMIDFFIFDTTFGGPSPKSFYDVKIIYGDRFSVNLKKVPCYRLGRDDDKTYHIHARD